MSILAVPPNAFIGQFVEHEQNKISTNNDDKQTSSIVPSFNVQK